MRVSSEHKRISLNPDKEQAARLSAEMAATVPFILMMVSNIVKGKPFSWKKKIVTAVYAEQEILHS